MKKRIVYVLLCSFLFTSASAQRSCNLYIVTSPDNRMQGFPFHFTVNGTHYKLKAGECLELKLQTDSIHIIMEDRRWVKNETVDLHTASTEDQYVRLFWGWKQNDRKKVRFFAEAICKTCFEEYKPKCKRELAQ